MRRRKTKMDDEEMTDEAYIEYCHTIIDYLECELRNTEYDLRRLARYVKKEEYEKYLKETTKEEGL